MFEKSATKFMRNRKMQLKYKCIKLADGTKPEDVSPIHWKKIVDLTNKSVKQSMSSIWKESTPTGKSPESTEDCKETFLLQVRLICGF